MNNFFDELEKNNINRQKNIEHNNYKNIVSMIIKWLCWATIVIGFIIGIINYSLNEDAMLMITTWIIYCGCSLGGFALAEIIQLLQDIKDRLEPNKQNNNQKYQKEDKIEKQNNKHKYTSDEIDNFLRD